MDKKDAYFESVKEPWKLPSLPSPNPTFWPWGDSNCHLVSTCVPRKFYARK